MNFKEVKITFKTITPLWTGDAWQENKEIRPSSLMGSLRFWFEVICYFAGICDKKDFNNGRFEKEVDRKKLGDFIKENGNELTQILCHLSNDQKIPLPSIIFGTTNWRSLIGIKEINKIEAFQNYPYHKGKLSIEELKYRKKDKEIIPIWFFKEGFYGKFEVNFKVYEEILETVFYPLITFMDKYGYWGGKWNIGYGRLKVEKIEIDGSKVSDWCKDAFNLEIFKLGTIRYEDDLIIKTSNFNELLQKDKDFKI
jgi:CRISPR-associated protein Cmr1